MVGHILARMKIVVFGPEQRVGALVGDGIIDLNRADSQLPSSLVQLIEAGEGALERVQRLVDGGAPQMATIKASDVQLHAPWPGRRIACAGGNFGEHLMGMESGGGVSL